MSKNNIGEELDEKQALILNIKNSTSIVAGAGAGKTTSLVESVVNDITDKSVLPEKISVITFTRSAASNIKDKIYNRLSDIGKDPDRILPSMSVGTIDYLNNKIINKALANTDFSELYFSLYDSTPQVAEPVELKINAVDAFKKVFVSLEDYQLESFFKSPSSTLLSIFEQMYLKEIDMNSFKLLKATSWDEARERLSSPVEMDFIDTLSMEEELPGDMSGAILTPEEHLKNASGLEETGESLLLETESVIIDRLNIELSENLLDNYMKKLSMPLKKNLFPTKNLGRKNEKQRASDETIQMIVAYNKYKTCLELESLSKRIIGKYREWKCEYERLNGEKINFNKMTQIAVSSLLAFKEAKLFEKVYLDESQDTSPLQYEIIKRLVSDNGLILIGDPNQSIYEFRGANVDNYINISRGFDSLEMNNNYRSHQNILDFVHVLFQRNSNPLVGLRPFSRMESPIENRREADNTVSIKGILKKGSAAVVESEAELASLEIKKYEQGGGKLGDIAILLRTHKAISVYEQVLSRLGIPVLVFSDKTLLDQEESKDMISYLRFIEDPFNSSVDFARVISSPFANFEINEADIIVKQIQGIMSTEEIPLKGGFSFLNVIKAVEINSNLQHKLNVFIDRLEMSLGNKSYLSSSEFLLSLIKIHEYYDNLALLRNADNSQMRVFKIIKYIESLDNIVGKDIDKLMDILSQGMLNNPEAGLEAADAVRIMTTHYAKGDEFNFVIVGSHSLKGGNQDPIGYLENSNNYKCYIRRKAGDANVSMDMFISLKKHEDLKKEKEKAEINRLLYVAATRAKENLLIINSIKAETDSNGNIIMAKAKYDNDDLGALMSDLTIKENEQVEKTLTLDDSASVPISIEYLTSNHVENELLLQKDFTSNNPNTIIYDSRKPNYNSILYNHNPIINYSDIIKWKKSPLHKKLEFDVGLKDFAIPNEEFIESTGAREFGIEIHKKIENLISLSELRNQSIQTLMDEEYLKGNVFNESLYRYLIKMLGNKKIIELFSMDNRVAEEKITFKLGDHVISSVIDYSASNKSGIYIADWKTGNWQTFDEIKEETTAEHHFQRRLYSFAKMLTFNNKEEELKINALTFYISEQDISYEEDIFKSGDLNNLRTSLLKEINNIII